MARIKLDRTELTQNLCHCIGRANTETFRPTEQNQLGIFTLYWTKQTLDLSPLMVRTEAVDWTEPFPRLCIKAGSRSSLNMILVVAWCYTETELN